MPREPALVEIKNKYNCDSLLNRSIKRSRSTPVVLPSNPNIINAPIIKF